MTACPAMGMLYLDSSRSCYVRVGPGESGKGEESVGKFLGIRGRSLA